jgi:hypothetical protein
MQLTFLQGYPDYIGRRFAWAGFGPGPSSYVAGGDAISFPRFQNYIDTVEGSLTPDGVYLVLGRPSAVGPRATWYAVWQFATTGSVASLAIATAGSGQTPGTYSVAATGGGGSGAVASITVAAGGTVTAVPIITSPGKNYTSAPTFTLAAGGTPATFTPTLSVAGNQVAAGANLSAEQVQLGGLGGVF